MNSTAKTMDGAATAGNQSPQERIDPCDWNRADRVCGASERFGGTLSEPAASARFDWAAFAGRLWPVWVLALMVAGALLAQYV